MTIRHATNGDWAAVSGLMQQQNHFHVDLVPHIIKRVSADATDDWCRAQLADADVTIFLADDDADGALGLAMIRIKRYAGSLVSHGVDLAYIEELFVVPGARRQGIARDLLAGAKEFAKSKGLSAVSLNVWGINKEAIAAYDALGFETVYQRMALNID